MSWRIINADVIDGLKQLPDESVHCVVTSPPYWGLRDYGVDGMIGLESTIDEYIAKMVAVCREIKRVLRKDGTFWLNMGDCYAAGGCGARDPERWPKQSRNDHRIQHSHRRPAPFLKPKDLVMQPARLALALQADGWWLRKDIIWAKPNPMPESCRDRPTSSHEHVFLLAKSAKYYYDQDAVREPHIHAQDPRNNGERHTYKEGAKFYDDVAKQTNTKIDCVSFNPNGRNLRDVWTIPTSPYSEAHFATFPEALVVPCIKAGTSEKGCCPKCGAPWERVVTEATGGTKGESWHDHLQDAEAGNKKTGASKGYKPGATIGWRPTCECGKEPVPCTVLDPFSGSGTTGVVAIRHGRNYIGIELNPEYVTMSEKRFESVSTGVKPKELKAGQKPLFEA